MTVLSFERHPVHPDHAASYEALLNELLDAARSQPGVLWADAASAFDDRPSYVVAGEWRTEADLDAWESSATFADFVGRADAWLREAPTRRRFAASS